MGNTMRTMDVNECPIFVSSADSYSDIWEPFFAIFKREWPEYRGTIYLNTQERTFELSGLKIVCTNVGKMKCFGETFLSGVAKIPCNHFLLLMIDYFFEGRVNVRVLQDIYSDFLYGQPDSIQLMPHPYKYVCPVGKTGLCSRILPPGGLKCAWFSFQAAFWDRASIIKYIRSWESPWTAEYFGTKRAEILNANIWTCSARPIPYDAAGVLYGGGKWNRKALQKIDFTGVPCLNCSQREEFVQSQSFIKVQRVKRLLSGCVYKSLWDIARLRFCKTSKEIR